MALPYRTSSLARQEPAEGRPSAWRWWCRVVGHRAALVLPREVTRENGAIVHRYRRRCRRCRVWMPSRVDWPLTMDTLYVTGAMLEELTRTLEAMDVNALAGRR